MRAEHQVTEILAPSSCALCKGIDWISLRSRHPSEALVVLGLVCAPTPGVCPLGAMELIVDSPRSWCSRSTEGLVSSDVCLALVVMLLIRARSSLIPSYKAPCPYNESRVLKYNEIQSPQPTVPSSFFSLSLSLEYAAFRRPLPDHFSHFDEHTREAASASS